MIILKDTDTNNEAKIFADRLDSGAEGLVRALLKSVLADGSKVRIMPDVHAGKGCVIGTAMTITDKIAPSMIGTDIGCGISAIKLKDRRIELQKLDKLIREKIPSGKNIRRSPHRFAWHMDLGELVCQRHVRKDKAYNSLGTLGGGNHFIEIDRGQDGVYWLVIHSGSRHLGAEVALHYQDAAYRESNDEVPYELAYAAGNLMADYLHDVKLVQEFARLNRAAIADEICKGMKLSPTDSFECVHNYFDSEDSMLRKGAISAKENERIIIPLNMRDGCLIGIGRGNREWNFSAPHGAGRLMNRKEARETFTLSQYKKEMQGIYSSCISRGTLDESPMVYKPMADIVDRIGDTVSITERIVPVYNFKAGEEE